MVVPSDLGRPRPGIVVQASEISDGLSTIFVCPVSSDLQDRISLRPLIEGAPENGLRLRSQIMTDKLVALRPTASGGLLAASTQKRPNNSTARSFCFSAWRCDQAGLRQRPSHPCPHLDPPPRIDHHCAEPKKGEETQ
jgi:mRNA-degrading endonuclease toxin of MazEF toxin-antitoxin module